MKKLLVLLLSLAWMGAKAQNPDSLTFAVLGNSISTYYDYLPAGYAVFYDQNREKNHGYQVGDTWWMQLSRLSGLTFLSNSSWSGSRVSCDELNSNSPFVSNHRMKSLGRAGNPDFIFIAGGTNDWGWGRCDLGEYSSMGTFTDSVTFRGAYALLLHKLSKWYPESKVVCLSLFPRGDGINQKNGRGWTQAEANASIKYLAKQFGDYYIDCTGVSWSSNWGASTFDYLHPTAYGASQLATYIYNALLSQKIITRALKRSAEVAEAERLLDISFTEEGIVNRGTCETRVGRHGAASVFHDAATGAYLGCSRARSTDYFYATYDEDSPLAEAFNSNVTWEMLVRLDGLADQGGTISRTCIMGSEQDGGWAFYNSSLASSFTYRHKSGVSSTMKSITGDSILVPGKFYHLVATMDRTSHTMRYFVNGKLACTGTRAGTDMILPLCGSAKGRRGMWICLGGDATSGTFSSGAESSAACSFVFARIYDGALSQKAAMNLYDDEVKKFTEPQPSHGTELILDCEFTPDGAVNHAPSFRHKPVVMVGEVPISYNPDINLYESQFSKTRTQLFKYFMGDASTMSQLSDAYSVEVYCRNSEALPSAATRPLGFVNGYGFGLQMNTKGGVGYTTVTQGNKADGTYAKTLWSWTEAGTLTDDYTHYVIIYDRKNYQSQFYINGELAASRWLTFKECPVYEWTPSAWLAIGGDAYSTYEDSETGGNYPFMGDVALVRVYGRALSKGEVQTLHDILSVQERSFTLGANGFAAVCLPFAYQVPEGCTAFVVTEIAPPSAIMKVLAEAGECVPYGTPVLIQGEAKSTITLTALRKNETNGELQNDTLPNLLAGTYSGRTLSAGDGFYIKATGTNIYRATSSVALPPFSCYLPSAEKRTFYKLEEDATGISLPSPTQNARQANGECFDLSGRRVKSAQGKGIYIKDGRKVAF